MGAGCSSIKKLLMTLVGPEENLGEGGDWSGKNGAGGVLSDYIWTKRQRRGGGVLKINWVVGSGFLENKNAILSISLSV